MSVFDVAILEERGYVQAKDGSWSKGEKAKGEGLKTKESLCLGVSDTPEGKKVKKKQEPSGLALRFEALWSVLGGKELPLTKEYRFHKTRKWRFDYAHEPSMVAIEIDGGIFTNGRHIRAQGFVNDCEKLNHAAEFGWHVFRLASASMVTGAAVTQIIKIIRQRLDQQTTP